MTSAQAHTRQRQVATRSTLASFKDVHKGETIVVCGCGESLNLFEHPERFVTIGVNDIGRRFHRNYLAVVNPCSQFSGDRFGYVKTSRASYLFSQYDDLRVPHPQLVTFKLGTRGGTDFGNPNVLHFTENSPYVALCLAIHMGAKRIGLIGVDFTEAHFFGKIGTHPLAGRLGQIDREYGALAQACRAMDVELVNLSPISRLNSLVRAELARLCPSTTPARIVAAPQTRLQTQPNPRRLFVVNYRFLYCGDVFADGLRQAADDLDLAYQDTCWDDAQLPARIERFQPDLVLVVHGRRFAQKWRDRFRAFNTAVWLVDEPYEVDDTARRSSLFGTVFVNDPNTLERHRNAHYLPVCFDPRVHQDAGKQRIYPAGFIGGFNATRERFLLKLAEAGLLGYLVGGPWHSPVLRKLCLASTVPAAQTAQLYQQTDIVLNVFRETHHYNAKKIAAFAMNLRIYEALACGAAVVSERRAEVGQVFPELPQFATPDELVTQVRELLADRQRLTQVRERCRARLPGHAYKDRLAHVLATALGQDGAAAPAHPVWAPVGDKETAIEAASTHQASPAPLVGRGAPVAAASQASSVLAVQFLPLGTATRRNLIYHVWPVRGSTWRWNLDELKRRVDLFNGKRIVGIVGDEPSDAPQAVQEYLEGHGFEYVVTKNDGPGEAATFSLMLDRVASTNDDELTFYAHAKGVRYVRFLACDNVFGTRLRQAAEDLGVAHEVSEWNDPALPERVRRFAPDQLLVIHGRRFVQRCAALQSFALGDHVAPERAAELYRDTRIVVNVSRERHHFNRAGIPAQPLNPRIYEGLACGAADVAELDGLLPELPTFGDHGELIMLVRGLLANPQQTQTLIARCRSRFAEHTYAGRLVRVLELCQHHGGSRTMTHLPVSQPPLLEGWKPHGDACRAGQDGELILEKPMDDGPGSELGLASARSFENVALEFDVRLEPDCVFIAKVHQQDCFDQTTNSYHAFCHPRGTYLATHNHVLAPLEVRRGAWRRIRIARHGSRLEVTLDGRAAASLHQDRLARGYCFLGVKGGHATLRNVSLAELPVAPMPAAELPAYRVLHVPSAAPAAVTIVTSVYDRVDCLRECVASVRRLAFRDLEQIVVADAPPPAVIERLLAVCRESRDPRIALATLDRRSNDWGITPASVGLRLARGRFLSFLSDDKWLPARTFRSAGVLSRKRSRAGLLLQLVSIRRPDGIARPGSRGAAPSTSGSLCSGASCSTAIWAGACRSTS